MLSPEGGVALAGLVVLGAAKPRGLNDNSSQFYSSIIVKIFPFCGLEECAMHIDNPQMRGMFFCGITRHECRGYDRLRILGGPPPKAKQTAGVRDSHECARRSFSLCDYPNNIRGNGHRVSPSPPQGGGRGRHYSVKGSITKRASESVKKRTYNLPSLTYARKADISNTNTCGSTLVGSTASIFWYNTTSS